MEKSKHRAAWTAFVIGLVAVAGFAATAEDMTWADQVWLWTMTVAVVAVIALEAFEDSGARTDTETAVRALPKCRRISYIFGILGAGTLIWAFAGLWPITESQPLNVLARYIVAIVFAVTCVGACSLLRYLVEIVEEAAKLPNTEDVFGDAKRRHEET